MNIPDKELVPTVRAILEQPFWLQTLQTMHCYHRLHDDTDGKNTGAICVVIAPDGDIHAGVDTPSLRFRTDGGGGASLRTRNALMILAEAIRLDNEDRPRRGSG